jgi:hypothetical protein
LTAFYSEAGRDALKRTIRHEAFHQWAYESIGPGLPVWVNEGIAQLFEFAVRVDQQMLMGEVPEVPLKLVQTAARTNGLVPFERVIEMQSREWFRSLENETMGRTLYVQTWAMTHFLVYAQGRDGTPLYRERFNAFLRDVATGRPSGPAWRARFGSNYEGFQKHFTSFILQLEPTSVSDQLDKQDIISRMIIHLAERGQRFESIDHLRRVIQFNQLQLFREQAGVARQSSPDPMVYFRDGRGRLMGSDRMRLQVDIRGELPQLVVRPGDGYSYRTRFYRRDGVLLHETRVSRSR